MGKPFEIEIRGADANGETAVEHLEFAAQSETVKEAVAEVREALEKDRGRSRVRLIQADR